MEKTPVTCVGTHICVVSRSAKNSQNGQKGNGGEDERLREIAGESYYTPYGFGMGPRVPLGGGKKGRRSSKSPPVIGGGERD